jgi:pyruvate/2-oxoglutarate dehydrogenase complex dihydrolipoamide acyltransferase (E2) component
MADQRYFTPLVRKLAASLGVDPTKVTGTGVGGRVRTQDVRNAAAGGGPRATSDPVGWNPQPYAYDEWAGHQNPDHPLVDWATKTNRIGPTDRQGWNQAMARGPVMAAHDLLALDPVPGFPPSSTPPPAGYRNPPPPSASDRAARDADMKAFSALIATEAVADHGEEVELADAEQRRRRRELYESGDL